MAFGHDLRSQREQLGVSLEALAAETRVTVRHLEALEHEHFDQLPGGVFRRGIVRAYLHALHLEEEPWMQRFQSALHRDAQHRGASLEPDGEAWAAFAEAVKRGRQPGVQPPAVRWLGVLLLLLAVAAAGLATWHFVLHRNVPLRWRAAAGAAEPRMNSN